MAHSSDIPPTQAQPSFGNFPHSLSPSKMYLAPNRILSRSRRLLGSIHLKWMLMGFVMLGTPPAIAAQAHRFVSERFNLPPMNLLAPKAFMASFAPARRPRIVKVKVLYRRNYSRNNYQSRLMMAIPDEHGRR